MLSFENVQSFAQNVESILHFIILKKRCRVVYGYTNLFIYFSVLIFLCERYRKPYTTIHSTIFNVYGIGCKLAV